MTFVFAFALSAVVGFASALIFIGVKGRSFWRFAVTTLLVAVATSFALLFPWGNANAMDVGLLPIAAAFFAWWGLVGGAFGAMPVFSGREIYRLLKERRTTSPKVR